MEEFIVFLFTSDWFRGRGDLAPLPTANRQQYWSEDEKNTVGKVDDLFGHINWRSELLKPKPDKERLQMLAELYKERLHKWFRYVLPFPFEPKTGQTYHLFMCSNYEVGVRITRDFYAKYTGNPRYSPDNRKAYSKFKALHPEKVIGLKASKRPEEWKMLWKIITTHEDGICDKYCEDLKKVQPYVGLRAQSLEWLKSKGYLKTSKDLTDAWPEGPTLYRLDWAKLEISFGVKPPPQLKPLSPMDFSLKNKF